MAEKILIVEDEAKIADALKDYFEKRTPYEVHTATDGKEAIALAKEIPFDLIVADVVMAGKDGIEVIQEIQGFREDIACIVITGFAEESTPIRALKIGVRDYIKKPFDPAELLNSAENLLKLRRLERESQQMRKSLESFRMQLQEILGMVRSTARLSTSPGPTALAEGLVRLGVEITGAAAGALFLVESGSKGIRLAAHTGVEAAEVNLTIAQEIAGRVSSTGQPICGSGEIGDQKEGAAAVRRCMLATPLEVGEEIVGVIEVFNKPTGSFEKRDVALMGALGRVGGMAISDNRVGERVKRLLVDALRQAVGPGPVEEAQPADRAIESLRAAMEKVDLSGAQERALRIAELIAEIGQQGDRELQFCEKMLMEFRALLKEGGLEDVMKPLARKDGAPPA